MCFSAIAVANTILDLSAKRNINDVTPMKLQKLIFFTHALYLKKHGENIISDQVEKWRYGPVYRDVYREFNGFGDQRISNYANNADGSIDIIPRDRKNVYDFIDKVLDAFGDVNAYELSDLTHMEGTAWALAGDQKYISEENMKAGAVYSAK